MANDYFEQAFAGSAHALARAAQVIAALDAVEAGFAKLPALRALLEDRVTAAVATGGPTAYVVTLTHPPTAYTDGMALNVRFPVANAANPNLDILDPDGTALGAKPIKQVDGTDLSAGHVAANARGELYYVSQGSGILDARRGRAWSDGAGRAAGRHIQPERRTSELIFSPDDGMSNDTNFGPVAPLSGAMPMRRASNTTSSTSCGSGGSLYIHVGITATTGTGVSDTDVWQALVTGLATVATSGSYDDLSDQPSIPSNSDIDDRVATWARANNPSGRAGKARVPSDTIYNETGGGGDTVTNLWFGTEAEFQALAADAGTVYFRS